MDRTCAVNKPSLYGEQGMLVWRTSLHVLVNKHACYVIFSTQWHDIYGKKTRKTTAVDKLINDLDGVSETTPLYGIYTDIAYRM